MRCLALAALALLAGSAAPALGDAPASHLLYLRTGTVDASLRADALDQPAFATGVTHVLVLDGPMTPEREAALATAGVTLLGYLPVHARLADVTHATPADVKRLGFVRRAFPYDDQWKVDLPLFVPRADPWRDPSRNDLAAQGIRLVSIWLFERVPLAPTLDAVRALPGARIYAHERVAGGWVLYASLPQASIPPLASIPSVQFAEETPEFTPRSNTITRWVVQTNQPAETPYDDAGIIGTGEIAGFIDGRVGTLHCAFVDTNPIGPLHRKILAYNTTLGYDAHGTHCAATLLGDPGDDGPTRGIAHGARMVFNVYPIAATEPAVADRFNLHYAQGARVHSNSWGDESTGSYNGTTRAIDSVSFTNDDQLLVFAVSDGTIIRNPENAKNCLAVAAGAEAPNQESFCMGGQGPTLDGRRKPELIAPGCDIISAAGNGGCGTSTLSGTSMACPAVAGAALLARQYFRDGFYPTGARVPANGFAPSGTLLKAVLVNSATDMVNVPGFPNATEGWGRVLLKNALPLGNDPRRLVVRDVRNAAPAALTTGGHAEAFVYVNTSTRSLKATLAFADAPAALNAALAPVNNLDLVAIDPTGATYLGNALANGVSTPGGTPDTLNNLEQVLIPAPTPGRWRIRVLAPAVNVGPQGFALAITGDLRDVPCPADLDDGSGAGVPDNAVDVADLVFFLAAFENGSIAVDLDDGSLSGAPDSGVDVNDLVYFLSRFEAGC